MPASFIDALTSGNLQALRKVPKSDLHNHCLMGGRLRDLERFYGKKLERFREGKNGIKGINAWIGRVLRPVFNKPGAFENAVENAFRQANSDGVSVLEMSIDATIPRLFGISVNKVISTLKETHEKIAPDIDFRPELGFPRNLPVRTILACFEPFLASGFFKSIDLYDDENAQPMRNFKEIYRFAKNVGMKCKAHAGEFGNAESVRAAVEELDLDAVQHGIGASGSVEVMKWLADRNVMLNVCPASNIALKRSRSYKTHPIRILYDHGVKVTLNTDDVMLFNAGNSEQFNRLYKCGLFSGEELDEIRMNGLSAQKFR